jgi:ABC-2 type transport system ATP-binding protein
LTALASGGFGVTQFREVQTDLEEAFMTVAQAEDDATADGSAPTRKPARPLASTR